MPRIGNTNRCTCPAFSVRTSPCDCFEAQECGWCNGDGLCDLGKDILNAFQTRVLLAPEHIIDALIAVLRADEGTRCQTCDGTGDEPEPDYCPDPDDDYDDDICDQFYDPY